MNKRIRIGLMPEDKFRERVLAIAKGEYKPIAGDPKIWFSSMQSLAEVLSDENRDLLKVIQSSKPETISNLAVLIGQNRSNLSRRLRVMSNFGLVEMLKVKQYIKPIVRATEFKISVR